MNPIRELKKIASELEKSITKVAGVKLSEIKQAKEYFDKLKSYSKMFDDLARETGEVREELIKAALAQEKITQEDAKWMDDFDTLWLKKIERLVGGSEADLDPFSEYDQALREFEFAFDVDI